MLYFLFFIVELLSMELELWNREFSLFQYILAFYIAYNSSVSPTIQNVNSNLVMIFFCLIVAIIDNSMYTIDRGYQYIIVSMFIWFLALQRYKSYSMHHNEYNPNHVMLLFYKPKKFREHFISLFGNDASTMSVVINGNWAKFRWGKKGVDITKFNEEYIKDDRYFIIDTGVEVTKDIEHKFFATKDAPARTLESMYLRLNCVRVFRPLLNEMGGIWTYRLGDFLPSIFALRRNLYK